MNGSPMGTMTGWINTEADQRQQARRSDGSSIFDRIFGRNHELARNSEQTMRLLVATESA